MADGQLTTLSLSFLAVAALTGVSHSLSIAHG